MQLTTRQDYAASPDQIHSMLTDERFLSEAATELGAREHRVAATASRSAVRATIEAPTGVRAFLGATLTLTQETTWEGAADDGSRSGTVAITIPGAPVSLAGELSLTKVDSGSSLIYTGELTVQVPLLGARIEQAAAPAILDALAAQERAAHRWLEEAASS
ncbi:MAG: DUF2505 domain-containing protein [Propioniciclava sp.]